MKKCVVVYNPESGRKKYYKETIISKLKEILEKHGYESKIYQSKYIGAVTDIVQSIDDDIDLVISIGGDGTFSESMRGNFNRDKKLVLAHLPTGTTNDVGKMYGYSNNLLKNADMLMKGEVREIDVCTINDEPFVYVAGFGKFLNIPYDTTRKSKKTLGYLAYIKKGLEELIERVKLYDLSYETNGEKYSGYYSVMLATNSTRIAGFNNIFDNIKLNDGKFEVLFCNIKDKKQFLKSLVYLKTNDIEHVPGFYYHKTDKIVIHNNRGKKIVWDIDGERKEIETEDITIKTSKAKILMPSKNINTLLD